jgi:glycosyltransferase involved in cell wall biosynthesis
MTPETTDILVISPHYNTFIKGTTDAIAGFLDSVEVLYHHNPLAELSLLMPWGGYPDWVRRFTSRALLDETRMPENVVCHKVSLVYLVPDGSNLELDERLSRKIVRAIQSSGKRYDLVHCHFTRPSGYVGARIREELGIPFILTAHGFDIYGAPFVNEQLRQRIKYVLDTADHIITVSNLNLQCIQKLQVNKPVTVIPNGFDDAVFYPRDMITCRRLLGLPVDSRLILTVGSLSEVKGHKVLIEALEHLRTSGQELHSVIAGSGELERDLIMEAKRRGVQDMVKFVGERPHNEIPFWINASDIFVLPSLMEGNPTVLFEAIGCGKPFVGSRVGGIPEVIKSDEIGLMCKPGDSAELADTILRGLQKEWNQAAILSYSRRFAWRAIAPKIIEVYEKVLRRGNCQEGACRCQEENPFF